LEEAQKKRELDEENRRKAFEQEQLREQQEAQRKSEEKLKEVYPIISDLIYVSIETGAATSGRRADAKRGS
jgi:Skp family chaperone for outer membrane proteins